MFSKVKKGYIWGKNKASFLYGVVYKQFEFVKMLRLSILHLVFISKRKHQRYKIIWFKFRTCAKIPNVSKCVAGLHTQ